MPQTIKPATPLPWNVIGNGYTIWAENEIIFSANSPRSRGTNASKDAAYIVHACNSYPRLVEALREAEKNFRYAAWLERNKKYAADLTAHADKCEYVLRELGGE